MGRKQSRHIDLAASVAKALQLAGFTILRVVPCGTSFDGEVYVKAKNDADVHVQVSSFGWGVSVNRWIEDPDPMECGMESWPLTTSLERCLRNLRSVKAIRA